MQILSDLDDVSMTGHRRFHGRVASSVRDSLLLRQRLPFRRMELALDIIIAGSGKQFCESERLLVRQNVVSVDAAQIEPNRASE
jgi:hypothetical protein